MLSPPSPGCVTVAKEDPSLDACMTGVDVKRSDPYAVAPSLGAGFFGADFFRGAFGANSKPTFPFSSLRCAEKGRPFLEMNLWSKSVLPVAIIFAPALSESHDAKCVCLCESCRFSVKPWHFHMRRPGREHKPSPCDKLDTNPKLRAALGPLSVGLRRRFRQNQTAA